MQWRMSQSFWGWLVYVPFRYEPNILTFGLVYARNFLIAFGLAMLLAIPGVVSGDGHALAARLGIIALLAAGEEVARYQFARQARRPLLASLKFALIINGIELTASWWAMSVGPGGFDGRAFVELRGGAVMLHVAMSMLVYAGIRLDRPWTAVSIATLIHGAYNWLIPGLLS